jgi:hypothetical protein
MAEERATKYRRLNAELAEIAENFFGFFSEVSALSSLNIVSLKVEGFT